MVSMLLICCVASAGHVLMVGLPDWPRVAVSDPSVWPT